MNDLEILTASLKEIEIEIDREQCDKLAQYFEMLIDANKVMNLTAITDRKEAEEKHFFDSLYLMHFSFFQSAKKVIDVGTGAGFPGIPLAVMNPEKEFTLLDSLNKRINFLQEVVSGLNLKNVRLIAARAEEAGRDRDLREGFDLCVSRAVASLPVLTELCLPFVACGGTFASYKGGNSEPEIADAVRAVDLCGGGDLRVENYSLPVSMSERSLVVIRKIIPTDPKYPRRPGIPSKRPLL